MQEEFHGRREIETPRIDVNQVGTGKLVSLSAKRDRAFGFGQDIQYPVRFRSVGEGDDESVGFAKCHDRDFAEFAGTATDMLKHGKDPESTSESGENRIRHIAVGFGDKARKWHLDSDQWCNLANALH